MPKMLEGQSRLSCDSTSKLTMKYISSDPPSTMGITDEYVRFWVRPDRLLTVKRDVIQVNLQAAKFTLLQ